MNPRGWIFLVATVGTGALVAYGPRSFPEPPTLISIATIVVAIVVALVQYAQWRTANQKVVIDLYDRRLKVFSQLEAAIGEVMREGSVPGSAFQAFMIAQADARFLFGDDVKAYLQTLREHLAWMTSFTDNVIDQRTNRAQLIDIKFKKFGVVTEFYKTAPELFGPYMNLSQKNIPFWRPW
jgi:hypothetical protein